MFLISGPLPWQSRNIEHQEYDRTISHLLSFMNFQRFCCHLYYTGSGKHGTKNLISSWLVSTSTATSLTLSTVIRCLGS